MWRAFKFCFSTLLTLWAVSIVYLNDGRPGDPALWIGFSMLVFFAALPWVDFQHPSRALALVIATAGCGIFYVGFRVLAAITVFPQKCAPRTSIICYLENLMFQVGGRPAAALPWILGGAFVLYGAFRICLRTRTGAGLIGNDESAGVADPINLPVPRYFHEIVVRRPDGLLLVGAGLLNWLTGLVILLLMIFQVNGFSGGVHVVLFALMPVVGFVWFVRDDMSSISGRGGSAWAVAVNCGFQLFPALLPWWVLLKDAIRWTG